MMSLHPNDHLSYPNLLKQGLSLIPNNPTNVPEALIWNTLIPSRHESLNDIDDSNDKKNWDDDEDDDQSPMPVDVRKLTICVGF